MDDAELQRLTRAARDHRTRAALARQEATSRGPAWWGYEMLQESADYYDRRAQDVERQLRRLVDRDPSRPAPAGDEQA